MIGFTRALGVRCSYCHKGEEGKPLSAYDFASDDNPNKNRAREMYRMLGDINDHLKKIEPSGDKRGNMWCHTCHHGRPRPMTLDEELGEQYRKKGLQAALDDYAGESPVAFGIDFGIVETGGTYLVEVNDGFSLGCLGLGPLAYSGFLQDRWKELVSKLPDRKLDVPSPE